jgi:hypothetical protein
MSLFVSFDLIIVILIGICIVLGRCDCFFHFHHCDFIGICLEY